MSYKGVPTQPADPAALARALLDKVTSASSGDDEPGRPQRYLVALAGIPGSGKSTFSAKLLAHLNASDPSSPPAVILPMDGFHRTQAELAADPDPELSFRRRGAPFTFAPDKLLDLVRRTRTEPRLTAPAFSHADKDPVEDAIAIEPHHRVVIVEGNYLLLDEETWRDVSSEMDERWFYSVPEEVALRRIIKRHVQAGLAPDEEAAEAKALENDVLNGRHCLAHMLGPDRVLEEVDHTVH
ncbi:P-loop containing nucleoside triphosphate hydrolase protein [Rhodotorula diobovata]|uniref:P-loop containing nucleoside triphosphate hydrolase protein n=1 Tax=Rhodotorula diobovata TaxID=5288 RepID=A0A5C5G0C0_9BASI|nr:P-loop containing nucleoside triphosphate hydrolase protein [Rhodotorula diobovata]